MNVRRSTMFVKSHNTAQTTFSVTTDLSATDCIKLSVTSDSIDRKYQASRIYFSIVDKYAPKGHEEIKALLKPLEFELNARDISLDTEPDSEAQSLFRLTNITRVPTERDPGQER